MAALTRYPTNRPRQPEDLQEKALNHALCCSAVRAVPRLCRALAPARLGYAVDNEPAYGLQLQGFDYPWPVSHFSFTSQGEALDMAYMDVKPTRPNGGTVVLLHGKNFCAATWQETIQLLVEAGYRAIAPDQIGFCKSSKPRIIGSVCNSWPPTPVRCWPR